LEKSQSTKCVDDKMFLSVGEIESFEGLPVVCDTCVCNYDVEMVGDFGDLGGGGLRVFEDVQTELEEVDVGVWEEGFEIIQDGEVSDCCEDYCVFASGEVFD